MEHPGSRRGHSDPYRVLGVDVGASQQDIARAYRRAAQRVHPDTRPKDSQAAARFRVLADAYDQLRDPVRRADYDRIQSASDRDPASQPVRPRHTGPSQHPPGQPYRPQPAPGQPVWAGPVHIEPARAASRPGQGGDPAAARFEDPPVILGVRPGPRWSWPW